MAKLSKTFKNRPYYTPTVGTLISDEQLAAMQLSGAWKAFNHGSMLAVDFYNLDGTRSDWFEIMRADGVTMYARFLMLRTFANRQAFWLVVDTSY